MVQQIICPTVLLHPAAKAPARSSDLAIGHDICCVGGLDGLQDRGKWDDNQLEEWTLFGSKGHVIIPSQGSFLFRTGFAQAIDPDYACLLWDRSGLGAMKRLGKLAGVIDPDYRGEWFVRLVNHNPAGLAISVGDKIVQGVYQTRIEASCPIVPELLTTARGTGAFGSTDKK